MDTCDSGLRIMWPSVAVSSQLLDNLKVREVKLTIKNNPPESDPVKRPGLFLIHVFEPPLDLFIGGQCFGSV